MPQISEPIRIVLSFIIVGLVALLIRRWNSNFSFGIVALVLMIVPVALSYFAGRVHWYVPVATIIGVLILSAELSGRRLRRRT